MWQLWKATEVVRKKYVNVRLFRKCRRHLKQRLVPASFQGNRILTVVHPAPSLPIDHRETDMLRSRSKTAKFNTG
jgi:hypothetical protein